MMRQDDTFKEITSRQYKQTRQVQRGLLKATQTTHREHAKIRASIAHGNSLIIASISSKMEDVRATISKTIVTVKRSNNEILFRGDQRDRILPALFFLKDKLRSAVLQSASNSLDQPSLDDIYRLMGYYDQLVVSATQEAAALAPGSTATPFDTWTYHDGWMGLSGPHSYTSIYDMGKIDEVETGVNTYTGNAGRKSIGKRRPRAYKRFWFELPTGRLSLRFSRSQIQSPNEDDPDEAGLTFRPRRSVSSTAIDVCFIKAVVFGSTPRLYIQLKRVHRRRRYPRVL